jgi:hypothetical protein
MGCSNEWHPVFVSGKLPASVNFETNISGVYAATLQWKGDFK